LTYFVPQRRAVVLAGFEHRSYLRRQLAEQAPRHRRPVFIPLADALGRAGVGLAPFDD